MNIRIEIEDRELLQYGALLEAVRLHFKKEGNENQLLEGGIEALQDIFTEAIIDQMPPERLKEITKKK